MPEARLGARRSEAQVLGHYSSQASLCAKGAVRRAPQGEALCAKRHAFLHYVLFWTIIFDYLKSKCLTANLMNDM